MGRKLEREKVDGWVDGWERERERQRDLEREKNFPFTKSVNQDLFVAFYFISC